MTMPLAANIANAALSLSAAGTWGTGDFVGGLASRRTSPVGVLLISQLTGMCGLALLAFLTHEPAPSLNIALWSLAAGAANVIGFFAFYRALAIGKMGVNAPVTAVITAAIPVIFSIVTEGLPRGLQFAGFLVALLGIWLLAKPDTTGLRSEGLGLAAIAGVLFSAFLILMKVAGEFTTGWPLCLARVAGVIIAGTLVLARHEDRAPSRAALPLAIAAGLLDSGGTIFFLPAVRHGRLDVAVVLSSLYPVTTVILARLFLKERLTPVQTAGVIAALAAVPMIAS
jgi:drug/metabolite transporter (DMT)-like permease